MGWDTDMTKAVSGMNADSGISYNESGVVAEGVIEFGIVVVKGTAKHQVKIAAADTDKVRGFALRIHNETGNYADKDTVTFKRVGRMYCPVSVTVAADQPVYVDIADAQKRLTNVSTSNLLVPTAVFRDADEGGFALVELNLP